MELKVSLVIIMYNKSVILESIEAVVSLCFSNDTISIIGTRKWIKIFGLEIFKHDEAVWVISLDSPLVVCFK